MCQGGKLVDSEEINKVPCCLRKFSSESFIYWRCANCGSIHAKEDVNLDIYYQGYPLKEQKINFWTYVAYSNHLKRLKKTGLKKENSILDFGCGKGLLIEFLRKKGYKASGYDPYVAEFRDEEALHRKYDFVLCQDVIEHVDDPAGLMKQLTALLESGGKLSIGTPVADNINLEMPEKYAIALHAPFHRHLLSESVLMKIASKNGLKANKIYRRWHADTAVPFVNYTFLCDYVLTAGNFFDVVSEKPRLGMIITRPKLLFSGFFGYYMTGRGGLVEIFFSKK